MRHEETKRRSESSVRNSGAPAAAETRAFGRDISIFHINAANKPKVTSRRDPSLGAKARQPMAKPPVVKLEPAVFQSAEMEKRNLREMPDYVGGILTYLLKRQHLVLASPEFLKNQNEVTDKTRAIVVDWMVAFHTRERMQPETLFLSFNIMDRFLELQKIKHSQLLLLAATSLLIASKYEEIYPPRLKEFMSASDKALTKIDFIRMELQILQALKYDISVATPYRFIERFGKVMRVDSKVFNLGMYLCELAHLNPKLLRHCPSLLAAGCMQAANEKIPQGCIEADKLLPECQHSEEAIKDCAKEVMEHALAHDKINLPAIKRKYLSVKFYEVAYLL